MTPTPIPDELVDRCIAAGNGCGPDARRFVRDVLAKYARLTSPAAPVTKDDVAVSLLTEIRDAVRALSPQFLEMRDGKPMPYPDDAPALDAIKPVLLAERTVAAPEPVKTPTRFAVQEFVREVMDKADYVIPPWMQRDLEALIDREGEARAREEREAIAKLIDGGTMDTNYVDREKAVEAILARNTTTEARP